MAARARPPAGDPYSCTSAASTAQESRRARSGVRPARPRGFDGSAASRRRFAADVFHADVDTLRGAIAACGLADRSSSPASGPTRCCGTSTRAHRGRPAVVGGGIRAAGDRGPLPCVPAESAARSSATRPSELRNGRPKSVACVGTRRRPSDRPKMPRRSADRAVGLPRRDAAAYHRQRPRSPAARIPPPTTAGRPRWRPLEVPQHLVGHEAGERIRSAEPTPQWLRAGVDVGMKTSRRISAREAAEPSNPLGSARANA